MIKIWEKEKEFYELKRREKTYVKYSCYRLFNIDVRGGKYMENSRRFAELVSDFEKRLDRSLNEKEKELLIGIVKEESIHCMQDSPG